jgi:acetyl-CoA carboxylase biotin carboxylase subunit
MFKKVLIANRGEIALRIIRTCKEMGIKTVAVYSTADRDSLHVRFADEAVCIGPPRSKDSYLNMAHIIAAVELTGADAVHPGYGFLAENAEFADLCNKYGVKFIGPTGAHIRAMGDKITAKETMIKAGVPCIPGSGGLVETVEDAKKLGKQIGYPVIIKATAGGGGKGMRVVHEEKEIEKAYTNARAEAGASFMNDGVYMEKFIVEPHHIEIQVAGDQTGKACHLSERDCSVQRRHQKLAEEAPSPFIDESVRQQMGEAAVRACEAIKYEGVGTIEFLVDINKNFYFMEMNTRIQVEHPVTEEVMDFDLIKEQLLIAAGTPISGQMYFPDKMHAIECRVNAEDPLNNFAPSPGKITALHTPKGYGVRVDTHIYAGYTIPPYYDSLLAKVICRAKSREECIVKMERALTEFIIEGVKTTIPFHIVLMNNPEFRAGKYDTGLLERFDYAQAIRDMDWQP